MKINKKDYYQVCCDLINIVEKNYTKDEIKQAYDFAMKETKKLDKK